MWKNKKNNLMSIDPRLEEHTSKDPDFIYLCRTIHSLSNNCEFADWNMRIITERYYKTVDALINIYKDTHKVKKVKKFKCCKCCNTDRG